MDEIPEAWWAVFNTLIAGQVACRTPAEVAAALGRDVEEVRDLLARWMSPDGSRCGTATRDPW